MNEIYFVGVVKRSQNDHKSREMIDISWEMIDNSTELIDKCAEMIDKPREMIDKILNSSKSVTKP